MTFGSREVSAVVLDTLQSVLTILVKERGRVTRLLGMPR